MFARIVGGKVAELTEDFPALATGECAHIEEVFDWDVQSGWAWTPEGFSAPSVSNPVPIENLDLAAITYTQADALIQAQTIEALKFAVLDILGL